MVRFHDGDVASAIAGAQRTSSKLLVTVQNEEPTSQQLDREFWNGDAAIDAAVDGQFTALKIMEGSIDYRNFTSYFPVYSFPTVYILAPNGKPVAFFNGSVTKSELLRKLQEHGGSRQRRSTGTTTLYIGTSDATHIITIPAPSSEVPTARANPASAPTSAIPEEVDAQQRPAVSTEPKATATPASAPTSVIPEKVDAQQQLAASAEPPATAAPASASTSAIPKETDEQQKPAVSAEPPVTATPPSASTSELPNDADEQQKPAVAAEPPATATPASASASVAGESTPTLESGSSALEEKTPVPEQEVTKQSSNDAEPVVTPEASSEAKPLGDCRARDGVAENVEESPSAVAPVSKSSQEALEPSPEIVEPTPVPEQEVTKQSSKDAEPVVTPEASSKATPLGDSKARDEVVESVKESPSAVAQVTKSSQEASEHSPEIVEPTPSDPATVTASTVQRAKPVLRRASTTLFTFKLVDGGRATASFPSSTKLNVVRSYVLENFGQVQMIGMFPRTDFENQDPEKRMNELGLSSSPIVLLRAVGSPGKVSRFTFKLVDGAEATSSFPSSDKLKVVQSYVSEKFGQVQMIGVENQDPEKSLKELGLYPSPVVELRAVESSDTDRAEINAAPSSSLMDLIQNLFEALRRLLLWLYDSICVRLGGSTETTEASGSSPDSAPKREMDERSHVGSQIATFTELAGSRRKLRRGEKVPSGDRRGGINPVIIEGNQACFGTPGHDDDKDPCFYNGNSTQYGGWEDEDGIDYLPGVGDSYNT